jgi:hypothetical protein
MHPLIDVPILLEPSYKTMKTDLREHATARTKTPQRLTKKLKLRLSEHATARKSTPTFKKYTYLAILASGVHNAVDPVVYSHHQFPDSLVPDLKFPVPMLVSGYACKC